MPSAPNAKPNSRPDAGNQKKDSGLLILFVVLLLLVVLGRALSYLYSVSFTDIAYPGWVSSLASYLAEIVVAVRVAVGFAAVVHAVYRNRQIGGTLACVLTASLIDYLARCLIDALSGAVSSAVFALIWVGTQFLYEAVFTVLAFLIAVLVKRKWDAAETPRAKAKYSERRAAAYAVLLYLVSRLVLEVWYLVDFLTSYTNITNAEIASIVGSFLKILVIYGGIAWLAASISMNLFEKRKQ